ncbi:MAG: SoxR reducing system RseC family protein [Lentimicrobium sp.]
MSVTGDCIAKTGVVDHLDDKNIYIRIVSVSACASCESKGSCSTAESTEKLIEVDRNHSPDIKPGQQVKVSMNSRNGTLAVILGYGMPFIILIIALVVLTNFMSEGIAGLISISLLLPYFAGLYFFRNRLKRQFRFTIEH